MNQALETRRKHQIPVLDLAKPVPAGPDVYTNDFLSLTNDPDLRQLFLDKLNKSPRVFGVAGSRLLGGNSSDHLDFETRMARFFESPAALLFNSGYDANVAFWHSVPQQGDVIVLDELVHASSRDGMAISRASKSLYLFTHNSPTSFEECVLRAIKEHPSIAQGKNTLFVAVEATYSMDGDFAPLPDIVRVVEKYVPKQSAHILVDEAHSTGVFGPQGRGLVHHLGLQDRIHTVLHTFGKGRALTGAVFVTSPIIRQYVINYGRPFIYTTALPISLICGLNASFDYLEGPVGDHRRSELRRLCEYFRAALEEALKPFPSNLLSLRDRTLPAGYPSDIISPITPIMTSYPMQLSDFLNSLGYAVQGIPYPVVPRGEERIRISVHALHTEAELDALVVRLTQWGTMMQTMASQVQARQLQMQSRL
ncbi:PLP-dependent transferase [Trametes versicolor FP-101664 SS1]|uniref:PLP-dependent transferase n=1 Tax=Trametes versicolor (strain FP-101664) TaxID=717944 RepID=UPI00046236CC|nr:PLP-dependent transferase [Trametes versicolor FP-101664 SS1]EIW57850.1 PLP-dependent transferase [Trametes versicolor FP-101664 SS1]